MRNSQNRKFCPDLRRQKTFVQVALIYWWLWPVLLWYQKSIILSPQQQQKRQETQSMKNIKFFRVEDCNGSNPFLVNADFTLSCLYKEVREKLLHEHFTIYYHFKPYPEEEYGIKKLKEIVEHEPMQQPTFLIYDIIEDGACPLTQKYGSGLAEAQKPDEPKKQYSIGENGIVVFDDRHTSILASSVNHATLNQDYDLNRKAVVKGFNESVIESNKTEQNLEEGLIRKVLTKLGILKKDASAKNLLNTINTIKNVKTKEDLLDHIDRQYSDYDPKFAAYLESIYLKYAILNGYRMHYIEYKNMQDGVIKYKFPPDSKVAIIGDFGTGLSDSFGLLRHIIIEKQADIIIHLGDVYYAGTPNQYKNHVVEPLNLLRKEAAQKFKKSVLFFSIPGNHDYYTWGLPFLAFVASINEVRQVTQCFMKEKKPQGIGQEEQNLAKQQSSYFCLQSQDSKWQFIGLDTAYHDSNPLNQINGLSLGPRLRQRQVQWFVDKMQHFPGSTILLTHHQLFSIHDRLCGSMSKYKAFTCINPLLSAQLFKYLPSISCWFWGHEHSLMLFADDVLGVRKCRLLGNSSFHVFEKEGPYLRKKGFPLIPLIQEDEKYMHKYLPLNPEPDEKSPDCYYNLSYALIDFSKQKLPEISPDAFSSTLITQYYCCPCYPEEQARRKHFQPYLLYEEEIQPRANINVITTEKLLKNSHEFVGNIHEIVQGSELFLKTQIGLFADTGVKLSIAGVRLKISIEKSVDVELSEKVGLNYQSAKDQQKEKVEEAMDNEFSKLLLDGDMISLHHFKEEIKKVSEGEKKIHSQPKGEEKDQSSPNKQEQILDDLLSKQPKLEPIMSIESSTDSLPKPAQQLVEETVINIMQEVLTQKKFEIRKTRIFKDASLHIKFGDAFTLREISSGKYLAVRIGSFGGILQLAELKHNDQPCLFMFVQDSKVKIMK